MNYNLNIKTSRYKTVETVNTDIKLKVTQSQLDVLMKFADVRKDSELNEVYTINKCEFTVTLNLDEEIKRTEEILEMCGDAPTIHLYYDL